MALVFGEKHCENTDFLNFKHLLAKRRILCLGGMCNDISLLKMGGICHKSMPKKDGGFEK